MSKLGVGLEGGLLEDATANHFFMALQSRGWPFSFSLDCFAFFF